MPGPGKEKERLKSTGGASGSKKSTQDANLHCDKCKGPATRNDIVDDPSSTMVFNVAKIASARASSTISLTKSLRVAGP